MWTLVAGAFITLAGVVVGAVLQSKLAERQLARERGHAERVARIERVARVLGKLRPLLADVKPVLMIHSSMEVVQKIFQESWSPIREEIGVLIATEPSSELRDKLILLDESVGALFIRFGQTVSPELREYALAAGDKTNVYTAAQEGYAETNALLGEILDDLHGSIHEPST
jgi:hypothetical protein